MKAIAPGQTLRITVDYGDPSIPVATFIVRAPSAREAMEMEDKSAESPDWRRSVFDGLRAILRGWENVTIPSAETGGREVVPYDPSRLEEVLTLDAAAQVFAEARYCSAAERKN